jgi:hypothetical protein
LAPKNVNKRLTDRGGRAPGGGCSWELKLGTIKNGRIKIHLRPAQKQQIASLLADACQACIIVGIKGAEEMYILSLEEALMVSGAIKGAGISQEGLEKALKEYARK